MMPMTMLIETANHPVPQAVHVESGYPEQQPDHAASREDNGSAERA